MAHSLEMMNSSETNFSFGQILSPFGGQEKKEVILCNSKEEYEDEYIIEESNECIICTDEKFEYEMVKGVKCSHSICIVCSSKINNCPFCRESFFYSSQSVSQPIVSLFFENIRLRIAPMYLTQLYLFNIGQIPQIIPQIINVDPRQLTRTEICNDNNLSDYSNNTYIGNQIFNRNQLSTLFREFKEIGSARRITTGNIVNRRTGNNIGSLIVRVDSQLIITPFFTFCVKNERDNLPSHVCVFFELIPFVIRNIDSTTTLIECHHKIDGNVKIIFQITGKQPQGKEVGIKISAALYRKNKPFNFKKTPILIGVQ
jgi:hypothetical protein